MGFLENSDPQIRQTPGFRAWAGQPGTGGKGFRGRPVVFQKAPEPLVSRTSVASHLSLPSNSPLQLMAYGYVYLNQELEEEKRQRRKKGGFNGVKEQRKIGSIGNLKPQC